MSDLIDRQAAIDAHCELCVDRWRCYDDICPDLEVFQSLPSVQPEPLTLRVNSELTKEEYDKLMRDIKDAPIVLLPSEQPEIIRCKDCKYCEHWYADKGRCFLWHEDGIDVFEDGFCNYAKRRTNE